MKYWYEIRLAIFQISGEQYATDKTDKNIF
jgi:hypothetical protein